jgi:hypothetical protein
MLVTAGPYVTRHICCASNIKNIIHNYHLKLGWIWYVRVMRIGECVVVQHGCVVDVWAVVTSWDTTLKMMRCLLAVYMIRESSRNVGRPAKEGVHPSMYLAREHSMDSHYE